MKECLECKDVKPLECFPLRKAIPKRRNAAYRENCKPCTNKKAYAYLAIRHTEEELKRKARESSLLRKYGITPEEYDLRYEAQGGCCLICDTFAPLDGKNMAVDHDHSYPSGCKESIRGLLCSSCNSALGLLKDSSSVVLRAAEYLLNNGK